MIQLTRLNHVPLVLNSDLIEHIESTPDTVIALTTGQKIMVLETAGEVVRRVVEYRRLILRAALDPPPRGPSDTEESTEASSTSLTRNDG